MKKRVGRPPIPDKRTPRSIKANDAEWQRITELAEQAGLSRNEYIIKKATEPSC